MRHCKHRTAPYSTIHSSRWMQSAVRCFATSATSCAITIKLGSERMLGWNVRSAHSKQTEVLRAPPFVPAQGTVHCSVCNRTALNAGLVREPHTTTRWPCAFWAFAGFTSSQNTLCFLSTRAWSEFGKPKTNLCVLAENDLKHETRSEKRQTRIYLIYARI